MKLTLALLSTVFAAASARKTKAVDLSKADITADSAMGQSLLSKARRLEQADEEVDFTWVSGYSLKFQGCHHIQQWNEEADGEEDVRIQTKRLVRFRLCPTGSCTYEDAGGCNSGYGDYIVDMNIFLESYLQAVEEKQEWDCEYTLNYVCDCDGENQGDDFNEEYCAYDCYMDKGMDYCVEENPYNQGNNQQEEEEEFELREYMECAGYDAPDNNNGRKLEEEEDEYFIGPYCADQGGKIFLGMFTDETCTQFADDYAGTKTYENFEGGKQLPYAEESIVGMECFSCMEPQDPEEQQNQNDAADEDNVIELCEEMYRQSGKCESYLSDATYPNENACNYIEGVKIIRKDGIVVQQSGGKNKTAAIFIGIFAVSFILLGAYVYYLKTKLDRAKINLSE